MRQTKYLLATKPALALQGNLDRPRQLEHFQPLFQNFPPGRRHLPALHLQTFAIPKLPLAKHSSLLPVCWKRHVRY